MHDKILKAWQDVVEYPLGDRIEKPRETGLTMVIDKGLSVDDTKSLLTIASDYIDLIKFGFGTSAFYSTELLMDKVKLIQSYNVEPYPGGTFLEVAVMQGNLNRFLARAKELGFRFIEVSDGTIHISDEVRAHIIKTAKAAGFEVITEVGKKNPQDKISRSKVIKQLESDLINGAYKVIVEGRESGKGVGIYNQSGEIDEKSMEDIVGEFSQLDKLIWEAPLKGQQLGLIERFGVNVNLGNIPAGEVLALEALRVGLRGDTLRQVVKTSSDNEYSWKIPAQVVSGK